ncbi:hypothetical protein CB1_001703007 [Camelus ferus]|nr:hypothetical protein CB1_001703007 [Camelus ferus]
MPATSGQPTASYPVRSCYHKYTLLSGDRGRQKFCWRKQQNQPRYLRDAASTIQVMIVKITVLEKASTHDREPQPLDTFQALKVLGVELLILTPEALHTPWDQRKDVASGRTAASTSRPCSASPSSCSVGWHRVVCATCKSWICNHSCDPGPVSPHQLGERWSTPATPAWIWVPCCCTLTSSLLLFQSAKKKLLKKAKASPALMVVTVADTEPTKAQVLRQSLWEQISGFCIKCWIRVYHSLWRKLLKVFRQAERAYTMLVRMAVYTSPFQAFPMTKHIYARQETPRQGRAGRGLLQDPLDRSQEPGPAARLPIPWPSQCIWMTAIVFTEVTVVTKCLFQLGFFPWNSRAVLRR